MNKHNIIEVRLQLSSKVKKQKTWLRLKNTYIYLVSEQGICVPFYRNETLLCKTSNEDMAENTCIGHFFFILRYLQNHNRWCVLNILWKFYIKIWSVNGDFWWFLAHLAIDRNDKSQTLKAYFSVSYFSIPQRSNGHNFT